MREDGIGEGTFSRRAHGGRNHCGRPRCGLAREAWHSNRYPSEAGTVFGRYARENRLSRLRCCARAERLNAVRFPASANWTSSFARRHLLKAVASSGRNNAGGRMVIPSLLSNPFTTSSRGSPSSSTVESTTSTSSLQHSARPRRQASNRERLVGAEGFEPPTLWSQTRCATRLRYAPTCPAEAAVRQGWLPVASGEGGLLRLSHGPTAPCTHVPR